MPKELSQEHLVIVDMQKYLVDHKDPAEVELARTIIAALVNEARELEIPVTAVVLRSLIYGRMERELMSLLRPGELVEKSDNDAFSSQTFQRHLIDAKIVHITGCNLEFCIHSTVKSAVRAKKLVVVHANAILPRDKERQSKDYEKAMHYLTRERHVLYTDRGTLAGPLPK